VRYTPCPKKEATRTPGITWTNLNHPDTSMYQKNEKI